MAAPIANNCASHFLHHERTMTADSEGGSVDRFKHSGSVGGMMFTPRRNCGTT